MKRVSAPIKTEQAQACDDHLHFDNTLLICKLLDVATADLPESVLERLKQSRLKAVNRLKVINEEKRNDLKIRKDDFKS